MEMFPASVAAARSTGGREKQMSTARVAKRRLFFIFILKS
jgi:hypothetical protein